MFPLFVLLLFFSNKVVLRRCTIIQYIAPRTLTQCYVFQFEKQGITCKIPPTLVSVIFLRTRFALQSTVKCEIAILGVIDFPTGQHFFFPSSSAVPDTEMTFPITLDHTWPSLRRLTIEVHMLKSLVIMTLFPPSPSKQHPDFSNNSLLSTLNLFHDRSNLVQ